MKQVKAFAAVLLALALPGLGLPGLAAAQEIGLMGGLGTSDLNELGSPTSLAVQVAVPLDPRGVFRVVGAYRFRVDTGERPGTVCDFYWPAFSACIEEPVAHDTRLTQWEVGMAVGVPLTERIEARASALRVRNTLEGASEGAVTGRDAGGFYPTDAVWSTAWVGSLVWQPGTRLPVSLLAQMRRESPDFRGCVQDVGAPFCGAKPLTTLEVGILLHR